VPALDVLDVRHRTGRARRGRLDLEARVPGSARSCSLRRSRPCGKIATTQSAVAT
jgi:hypothetical protein